MKNNPWIPLSVFFVVFLFGCTAAPSRPTTPAGAFPAHREVPLTADVNGYPISPTMGALTGDRGWGAARPPVVLHHLAHPERRRAELMVDTTRGVTVFWAMLSADGQILEWAGDPTVLRPGMPAASRAPRGIEAVGP